MILLLTSWWDSMHWYLVIKTFSTSQLCEYFAVSFLDFSPRIPLHTSSILLCTFVHPTYLYTIRLLMAILFGII